MYYVWLFRCRIYNEYIFHFESVLSEFFQKHYLHLLQVFQRVQEGHGDPRVPVRKTKTSKDETVHCQQRAAFHSYLLVYWST